MNHAKKKKIIWAVDISQTPKEVKNLIAELKIWAERINCDVLPVAVFPKAILDVPLSLLKKRKQYLLHEAENDVNRFLSLAGAAEFLKPEVLLCSSGSNRAMAQTLISYAVAEKATMIFANSHTKKLWNRFLIGGFALTLTSLSHIPVMLMTLKAKPEKKIRSIIFPTDFSSDSKTALDYLKPIAKSFGSKIVLFNQIESFNYLLPPFERIKKGPAGAQQRKMKKDRTAEAKSWAAKLTDAGIPSQIVVKNERKTLWEEVDSLARSKKASLVALSSNGSPAVQSILGSVTRNIVASAKYPVLVFHEPLPFSARKQQVQTKYHYQSAEKTPALHS